MERGHSNRCQTTQNNMERSAISKVNDKRNGDTSMDAKPRRSTWKRATYALPYLEVEERIKRHSVKQPRIKPEKISTE